MANWEGMMGPRDTRAPWGFRKQGEASRAQEGPAQEVGR